MKLVQRISFGVALLGALMVSVHSASTWLYLCSSGPLCLATVYFGLTDVNAPLPPVALTNETALSTAETSTGTGFIWSEVHRIVFIVGLYALLLGGTIGVLMKVLEVTHLNVFSRRRKSG